MAIFTPREEYEKIWLADFFHGFPHVDLEFKEINSTFDPENRTYREALIFWAGVPLVWCVLLWLAFLIFFCLRCCRKSECKQTKTACSQISAGLFLFMGCGALGAAFYGNETVHDGVADFVEAVRATNTTIENAQGVLDVLDSIAKNIERKDLPSLLQAVDTIANVTVIPKIKDSITQIQTNFDESKNDVISVRRNATQVNTEHIIYYSQMVEYYRWVSTVTVFCVFVVIFLTVFIGLLKRSKWILMLAATLSLIFVLFVWLATAVYLALSVAAGDLCVDPDSFVVSRVQGTIKKQILLDYIDCKEDTHQTHILDDIVDAQQSVSQAITALNTTVNISGPYFSQISAAVTVLSGDLKAAFGNLSSLSALVGNCDAIHGDYVQAQIGICYTAQTGLAFLVLFSAIVGMCSAVVVLCSALTWPYLGKRRRHRRRRDYAPVDDTDPFLPNPPPYEQDYGSMRQATVTNAAASSSPVDYHHYHEDRQPVNDLPLGESPPPAYQAGNYMQQYYNLAPRPSSIQQSASDA